MDERRLPGLGAMALLFACSSEQPVTHVAWPETPFPFAMLLELGATDVKLVAGPLESPGEPLLLPEPETGELVLAGLTEEALHTLHPRIDRSGGVGTLTVSAAPEACEGGRALDADRRSFPMPTEELDFFGLRGMLAPADIERTRSAVAAWSVETSIDPAQCVRADRRPQAFAAAARLVQPGAVLDGQPRYPSVPEDDGVYFEFLAADWISENAVAVSTRTHLYWIARGAQFEDTLSLALAYGDHLGSAIGEGPWGGEAIERVPGTDGRLLVGVRQGDPERAAVLLIDTTSGRFEVVSSSVADGQSIQALAIDARGRFITGGRDGRLGYGTVADGIIGWGRVPGELRNLDKMVAMDGNDAGFLVGSSGGTLYSIRWPDIETAERVPLPGDPGAVSGLSGTQGGNEPLYVLLRPNQPAVLSNDGEHWVPDVFDVPKAAQRCAQEADQCGARSFASPIFMIGPLDETSLLLSPRVCAGLFVYEPQTRCLHGVPLPGAASIINEPGLEWFGVKRFGGRAIALGRPALLVEVAP